MRSFFGYRLCAALLAIVVNVCQADNSKSPPNVIFDTDIWSDIDDMLALAMLHTLHDRHEVNLVAVTISTDDPWCASYVDLVNTFYGHPQIPVGIVHNGMTLERFRKEFLSLSSAVPWRCSPMEALS